MSGPCLSSSVAGRPLRPATRHSLGEPLPHQLADRPRAHQEAPGCPGFDAQTRRSKVTCGINSPFGELSPTSRHVANVLRTRMPLDITCIATNNIPFDLHVLSTPPAFVLSQNQTLREKRMRLSPQSLRNRLLRPLLNLTVHTHFSLQPEGCQRQWGLFSLIVFEIKDLTYNAQFNFCLLSTPSCLGAFDRSELAHSAPIGSSQLSLRFAYSRGVV